MPDAASAPPRNALRPGDRFPPVRQRSANGAQVVVDAMAGRYIVMCFLGSLGDPVGRLAIEAVHRHSTVFDDEHACLFGVSMDPQDEIRGQFQERTPGIRILWDFDGSISQTCGALPIKGLSKSEPVIFLRSWIIVDPTLHVLRTFTFSELNGNHDQVLEFVRALPSPGDYAGLEIPAPVLVLPNVLEPRLCRHLITQYEGHGGVESGVMQSGIGNYDGALKRRKDFVITDSGLCGVLRQRISRRVVPEVKRLFFLDITKMERYTVGCYSSEDGGHFAPHRDNNQDVTAHRRFAVSINLNDDFDGGAISFPEYNGRGLKVPTGWAVVFPCAILHAVSQVTSGRRYAFLPFLYDEEGAKLRAEQIRRQQILSPEAEPGQSPPFPSSLAGSFKR